MIASSIGLIVLAGLASMTFFATRSFAALGNYSDLDSKSRNALDRMSRELREATAVVSFKSDLPVKSLTLTNSVTGATLGMVYDQDDRVMTFTSSVPAMTVTLTDCDRWDFSLYQRTPLITGTNILFYSATNTAGVLDPAVCKVLNMSWQCSRSILGRRANTETIQTAQIVLRNKL